MPNLCDIVGNIINHMHIEFVWSCFKLFRKCLFRRREGGRERRRKRQTRKAKLPFKFPSCTDMNHTRTHAHAHTLTHIHTNLSCEESHA